MFDIILRYLYGFAKIHIRSVHVNRFINLCKARDIKLWDLEQKENEIFFFVAAKDIAHLKEPALKTGSEKKNSVCDWVYLVCNSGIYTIVIYMGDFRIR